MPRHKQSAVSRNRLKRRLRELSRQSLLPMLIQQPPMDLVLRASPTAYGAGFADLADDIGRVAKRIGSLAAG